MDEREIAILRALLKNGKMTFQQVFSEVVLNRNSAHSRLKKLINLELVRKTPKKWRRGQKLWFSLTKKGRTECLRQSIDDLNASLRVLQDISGALLSNRSRIDEFRQEARQALFEIEITESMPLEERIRIASTEMKRIYGPLSEACKAMNKLMIQIMAPKDVVNSEFFIGFSKEGFTYMLPEGKS